MVLLRKETQWAGNILNLKSKINNYQKDIDLIHINMLKLLIAYLLILSSIGQNPLVSQLMLQTNPQNSTVPVITNGILDSDFSDSIYNRNLCCNTQLYILQLKKDNNNQILFTYQLSDPNITDINPNNITIQVQKQGTPLPSVNQTSNNTLLFKSNCPEILQDDNYWSKVDITIISSRISFRLNCDYGKRHRNFQWGYIIIMVINSIIMVGVALHSRIWSMKWKNKALGVPVKWPWLLAVTAVVLIVGAIEIYVDSKNSNSSIFGTTATIVGDVLALIFGIINLNQIFFLIEKFKQKVWKFFRICDILSIITSMIFVTVFGIIPELASNYVLNNLLSIVISVGAIKLFKFLNLKDAIICCFVVFATQNVTAVVLHYIYQKMSYNDLFGASVSSPLVMQISTLSYSLYQKCSWLPVTEIILPGITIAYLRRYDFARDTKLYFIIGNTLFVISTFLWIVIQSTTVHSIPFSLITYPLLFVPILILSYKRDQLNTLMNGKFYDPEFMDSGQTPVVILDQSKSSFDENMLSGLIPQAEELQSSHQN